jgi:uncharacterized protein (TIGR01777 family)
VRVVIAGGTGLIGRRVGAALAGRGDEVVVLSRRPVDHQALAGKGVTVKGWSPHEEAGHWTNHLRGADAVINLAGSSVGAWPWTRARMHDLVESRLVATDALVEAIHGIPSPDRPRVLVSASGTDIYEGNDVEPATEETAPVDAFLARLCVQWEAAASRAREAGTRVVITRMSLVIDHEASALGRFALPVKLFAGGRLGAGTQWISWIHSADVVGLMLLVLDGEDLEGAINFASPDPHQQADFSRVLARVLHRPFWLPTPAWAIHLVLGRQSTLALGSRRVAAARALGLGYTFKQPTLEGALRSALISPG